MKLSLAFIALVLLISFYSGCKKEQQAATLANTAASDTTKSYYIVSGTSIDFCYYQGPLPICGNDTEAITNDTIIVIRTNSKIIISNISFAIDDSVIVSSNVHYYDTLTSSGGGLESSYGDDSVYFYHGSTDSIYWYDSFSVNSYSNGTSYSQGNIKRLAGRRIQ